MGLALLALLKNNWKLVLIGVAAAVTLVYVLTLRFQVEHYKEKAADLAFQLQSVKDQSAALKIELASANKRLQDAVQREVDRQIALIEKESTVAERNIKDDKISRSISIPASVVRLFNATTGSETGRTTDAPKVSDDKASTPATPAVEESRTVNDLLVVSAVNNKNHLLCNEQVLGWQQFWIGYVQSLGYTPPQVIEPKQLEPQSTKETWLDLREYATS